MERDEYGVHLNIDLENEPFEKLRARKNAVAEALEAKADFELVVLLNGEREDVPFENLRARKTKW